MSYNELIWWQAYASLRPLEPIREDIKEARIVGAFCGKSPKDLTIDWFDKKLDPEYQKQEDAKILAELRELKAKRIAEENGQTN